MSKQIKPLGTDLSKGRTISASVKPAKPSGNTSSNAGKQSGDSSANANNQSGNK